MTAVTPPRYELCLLSHGRQAAYALWCHLGEHPGLFLPDFAYSDGLLLEDAPYAPEGPYAYQLALPGAVPGMRYGILVHLFSHLDRMPGPYIQRLWQRCSADPLVVLVPRDPIANLRSMYRTQLELFYGRRYFDLRLEAHPLYDRDEPVNFPEYMKLARYGVDYGQQIEGLCPGARLRMFDFADLGAETLDQVLSSIVEELGLDPEPMRGLGREPTNPGGELIHQRLFSFRSRIELGGQRVDVGFFWRRTDPALRGSYEIELPITLEGGGELAAFASTATWFALPPKARTWLVEGEGREQIDERWSAYQRFREQVSQQVEERAIDDPWSAGGHALEEWILPGAREFRSRWPEATRSWKF